MSQPVAGPSRGSPVASTSGTMMDTSSGSTGGPRIVRSYTYQETMDLEVHENFIQRKPTDICRKIMADDVTFYQCLRVHLPCKIKNCPGHFKYGVFVEQNLPVEFLCHDPRRVAYYWPYVHKACLPFRLPRNGEELMSGIRWNTLTPRNGLQGIKNSCMIDGWLTDIKIRTLDVTCCLGCWFIHTTGRGLKIEKTLRTLSKFILMCASPTPDASGQTQIIHDFTHEEELYIKTIWMREKFWNFDSKTYSYVKNGVNHRNKLIDLLDDPITQNELVTRMSMYR